MKYPRGKTAARGYGGRWQRERARFLKQQENVFCRMCKERDLLVLATDVDHKIPHKGDQLLMWDKSNWQALCKSCHTGAKQSQDRTGITRGIDATGAPLDPNHRWNRE